MKKTLFALSSFLLLSACSAAGINEKNAEKTADYIKSELAITDDIEESKEEINYEVREVFNIGDHIDVVSNKSKGLEQVTFNNTDNIDSVLEVMNFPKTDTVDGLLDSYLMDIAIYGSSDVHKGFVINDGVGLFIYVKPDIMKEIQGDKPFSLTFVYNEERFEDFKEKAK